MNGIESNYDKTLTDTVFIMSVQATLLGSSNTVKILSETVTAEAQRMRGRRLSSTVSIAYTYQVSVLQTVLPPSAYQTLLTQAVSTGTFTTVFQTTANTLQDSAAVAGTSNVVTYGNSFLDMLSKQRKYY